MDSKDYWVKRALQAKQAEIDKDEQLCEKLAADYDTLKKSIDDELAKFYGRYATNEGITMAEAKKRLSNVELENFRMSLDEFKEKALKGGYDKELNEIYLRSRISRLQALQTQLDMMVQGVYQEQHDALSDRLKACYTDTYYQTVYQIQDMSGVYTSSFAHIDEAALNKTLTTPWLESNFSSRVWNNRDKLIDELHTVLTQAFVRGDSLDKVSRLLAKRMDVSKSRADALVQTEAGHIAEQATLDGYRECDTTEYRYLATLDIKTCGICGPLDDRVFPVSEAQPGVNYPLMHTRCRCTTVAEVPYRSETRMSRDPATGKSTRVERMSFQEWHKKYVEDVPEGVIAEKKHKNQYADKAQYQKEVST
ncbi:MAG: minor capsid protein [Eubacteriales bacterium]|nr:minor capsid protein [Eubacteriales bacterium]